MNGRKKRLPPPAPSCTGTSNTMSPTPSPYRHGREHDNSPALSRQPDLRRAWITYGHWLLYTLAKTAQPIVDVRYLPGYLRLAGYKSRHAGETCVVVGNGPSLKKTDTALLNHVPTFGMNRIYIGMEDLGFVPSYYVCVNAHVLDQCKSEIRTLGMPRFLRATRTVKPPWPDSVFLRTGRVLRSEATFSSNPLNGTWEGATVTYVCLQLAYWMGFSKVILVGVDHSFSTSGPAHKLVTAEKPDENHFSSAYFDKGFKWQLPDLEQSELAYRMADWVFRQHGGEIVDCTVDGKCPVFRKSDLRRELDLP